MLAIPWWGDKKGNNHKNPWEFPIKFRKRWFIINRGTDQITSIKNEWIPPKIHELTKLIRQKIVLICRGMG